LPARKRACEARPGLAKCGWGRRGSECEPKVRGDT